MTCSPLKKSVRVPRASHQFLQPDLLERRTQRRTLSWGGNSPENCHHRGPLAKSPYVTTSCCQEPLSNTSQLLDTVRRVTSAIRVTSLATRPISLGIERSWGAYPDCRSLPSSPAAAQFPMSTSLA